MRASSVRRGNIILFQNAPHKVMEVNHHTPGNLRALVQVKLRNLLTGNQTENRFSATEDLTEPDVYSTKATFLYSEGDIHHFMNSETYEQLSVDGETIGDSVYYLQDQTEVGVTFYNGSPISIEPPQTVTLTIEDTEPEIKGATANNSPKPATTTTGLSLSVPPFVNIGDQIQVNTSDGSYLKRAD